MKLWFLNQIWLLSLSGFLLSVSAGIVRLEAKPPKIDYLDTNELTVNCTFDPDTSNASRDLDLHRILYLSLSKQQPEKAPRHLVHMDQSSHLPDAPPESQWEPSFHGLLSNHIHGSYLSVTWKAISEDLIGSYVCEAGFLTKTGDYVSDFKQTTVVEERKLSQTLVEEVKRLNDDLKTKISILSTNLDAKFFENQSWREKMSLSVSYLEKTLLMSEPSEVHRNRMYYISRYNTYDVSSAEAVCQTVGGYLVEVNDNDEFRFLTSTYLKTQSDYIFIAGRRNVTDDTWHWPRTNQLVSFTSWWNGEPNNFGNNEHCLEIMYYDGKHGMNDLPCRLFGNDNVRYKRYFICEIPVS